MAVSVFLSGEDALESSVKPGMMPFEELQILCKGEEFTASEPFLGALRFLLEFGLLTCPGTRVSLDLMRL